MGDLELAQDVMRFFNRAITHKNLEYQIYCKFETNRLDIYLHLNGKDYKEDRRIGFIIPEILINGNDTDAIRYVKNQKEKDLYQKYDNAVGICNDVIRNLREKDNIQVNIDKKQYKITVAKFNKFKEYKHFKSNSLELQALVPISKFTQIK